MPELLKNSSDLFAVTIPFCANDRCRRNGADDGSTTLDGIAVLLLPFGRSNPRKSSATADRLLCGSQLRTETSEKSLHFGLSLPIDPELLLCLLFVGYLYRISSERRRLEEVRMHLARYRHATIYNKKPWNDLGFWQFLFTSQRF
jgi:hypothetical protein